MEDEHEGNPYDEETKSICYGIIFMLEIVCSL